MQLVIGAGAIGTATAQLLADRGERVRLVTRGGGGPEHSAVERVAADASDADALSRLAEGMRPHGVAVHLEGTHLCTQMRGVREERSSTWTSFWRGAYEEDPRLRDEFFRAVRRG